MRTVYSSTVILTLIGASLISLNLNLNAQPAKRIITGVVLSERGDSVGFITIKIKGTKEGTVSNSAGVFTIATALKGSQTLIVKNLAYEPFEQKITLENDSDTIRTTIQLLTKVVNLKGATVSASAFTSGDMEGVTLKPLEILTTPGAAADIFRALQTFPGVTSPDEGSGLIVRGGDINETVTLIDQASVAAPYRAQAPNGGTFGFIPPFFVSGTFFSSGGMPARYGNALSGVVALEGLGMPTGNQATATLSTGGVSLGGATQLVPKTLGLRASGNYSNTDVLFRLNGSRERFMQPPTSIDINASLVWKYSTTGSLKVFSHGSQNGLQTFYGFGTSQNLFKTAQMNMIHNVQLTDIQVFQLIPFATLSNKTASAVLRNKSISKPAPMLRKISLTACAFCSVSKRNMTNWKAQKSFAIKAMPKPGILQKEAQCGLAVISKRK
jgi:vitamin B12 transporter